MSGIYNSKPIIPVIKPNLTPNNNQSQRITPGQSFEALLQQQINNQTEVKFSKHALERLQARNIKLTKEDVSKINDAVNKAAEKGVKEALIIMGNTALVTSIKNKTVITAATEETLKNNVFTNIDGAVII
ncbi:MAG: flagellar protein [Clostridiales bacterium GWB2_37_7]|nr:MAG: flagellar protein [Clostridiales bacterium GWB2_37_7]